MIEITEVGQGEVLQYFGWCSALVNLRVRNEQGKHLLKQMEKTPVRNIPVGNKLEIKIRWQVMTK